MALVEVIVLIDIRQLAYGRKLEVARLMVDDKLELVVAKLEHPMVME